MKIWPATKVGKIGKDALISGYINKKGGHDQRLLAFLRSGRFVVGYDVDTLVLAEVRAGELCEGGSRNISSLLSGAVLAHWNQENSHIGRLSFTQFQDCVSVTLASSFPKPFVGDVLFAVPVLVRGLIRMLCLTDGYGHTLPDNPYIDLIEFGGHQYVDVNTRLLFRFQPATAGS